MHVHYLQMGSYFAATGSSHQKSFESSEQQLRNRLEA